MQQTTPTLYSVLDGALNVHISPSQLAWHNTDKVRGVNNWSSHHWTLCCSSVQVWLRVFNCIIVCAHAGTAISQWIFCSGQSLLFYRPFRCELSPRSESIKNRCYTHYYYLYRLHPLVRKSYRRSIAVTQFEQTWDANKAALQHKIPLIGLHSPGNSLDGSFFAVALLCWRLRYARICVTGIGQR